MNRLTTITLLFLVLIVGAGLRFYDIGEMAIDGDNVYNVHSIHAINRNGIPRMPSGELYLRAVPLNYLQTWSFSLFSNKELGVRVPNAAIGVLNILLVYLFSVMLSGKTEIGLAAALLFAVSPVAVYFARMPRMYETFLFSVLGAWICFYAWYFRQKRYYLPGVVIFSILAITLHEAAIIPLVFFLTPIVIESRFSAKLIASISMFAGFAVLWMIYPETLQWMMNRI